MPIPYLKNKGPLLVDKVRGYFDRLPPWLRDMVTIRVEKQKVDAKISDLDPAALESELKQEVTDEKLRTNRYLGDGEAGSGNDMSQLPASQVSEIVITGTGQVADVTETVSASEQHLVEGPPLQDGQSEQVGDLWVTKKVEAPTFDHKAFQASVEDLLPPEFRAAIPEKLVQHTVDGEAVMPVLSAIDLVKREEQQKVGVKQTTVQSRDTTGAKPTLVGQRIDPEFNGVVLTMAKDIVPDTTVVNQVFGITDEKVTPYDDKNAVKERWSTGSFPTISLRNYDAELDSQVVTSISVVPMGSALPALNWYDLEYQERKIDSKHSLRLISSLLGVPAQQVTYSTQMITFPSILSYISFSVVALATANAHEVQWTAGVRSTFAVATRLFTVTNVYPTEPDPTGLFVWKQADITFKGISYTVSLNNVLTDAWTSIGVTFAGDVKYGNLVDRFSIQKTVPSASEYVAAIGQNRCISSVVERYKRVWVKRDTFALIQ